MRRSIFVAFRHISFFLLILVISNCEKETTENKPSGAPVFNTSKVLDIKQTSATIEGILSEQSQGITRTGACYSTESDPDIEDERSTHITKLSDSEFNVTLNNLEVNTTYYVKVYAENEFGVGYGEELSLTTLDAEIPMVRLNSIGHITQNSAICQFKTLSDSGSVIITKGVCWSLEPEPTINDGCAFNDELHGDRTYECKITSLLVDTVYYVRAFATNSVGTAYSNVLTIETLPESGEAVTDIEGNEYFTVVVGEQIWLNNNLESTVYNDGTPIAIQTENEDWSSTEEPAYCWYQNSESNKEKYGALYNGYVVLSKNICPTGWRVPTLEEYELFIVTIESSHGVTAPESGKRFSNGEFCCDEYDQEFAGHAEWWTSTQAGDEAHNSNWSFTSYGAKFYSSRNQGLSIRCIKDMQ